MAKTKKAEGHSGPRVGEVLSRARKAAGLTQAALAKEAGLVQAVVSQIEAGGRDDPRFSTVAKIAAVVGVSLDQIAFECGMRAGHRPTKQDLGPAEQVLAEEEIARALRQIDDARETLKSAQSLVRAKRVRSKRKT